MLHKLTISFINFVCINLYLFFDKAIIGEIVIKSMNLKQRGITVGDLLIFLIVIVLATFVFKKLKNEKPLTLNIDKSDFISLQLK